MQMMYSLVRNRLYKLRLPDPGEELLPGIRWGRFDHAFTPAYWRGQAWQHEQLGTYAKFTLGRTLAEEVAACLLGGFGIRAEMGLAAFFRMRDRGLLAGSPAADVFEHALTEPFQINGRDCKYRFPRVKSLYLAECLRRLRGLREKADDRDFRDQLTELPGVGLKTASWIVRNYRASCSVAIIDIHILRAGRQIGIFDDTDEPQQRYRKLEDQFLGFANAIGASSAVLDGVMWDHMRRLWMRSAPMKAKSPSELQNASPEL